MRLTSWLEKGLDWSSSDEMIALQTRIRSMVDKNVKLVNVIQVMLARRILPCRSRTCHLWEFDPAKHRTLQQFFGTMHEDIWKVLWGVLDEDILTALGHLPEYPTCSKAMCWYGIRCTMNFAGPVKPSLQYGSTPCSGLLLLCN